jgi:predicted transcriptional regulator of viral defense system
MYTLLKPIQIQEELITRGVQTFSPYMFARMFHVNQGVTKHFLETHAHDGFLMRLKKGLYTLRSDVPSEEELANNLYQPSYISFEYALAYYNILPEMPYTVTSATTKPTRIIESASKTFAYYSVKPDVYAGYSLVKTETKSFLIADPEKALADYLYFVVLGKRTHNDRFNLRGVNFNTLLRYARMYKRKKLIAVIKKIYASS